VLESLTIMSFWAFLPNNRNSNDFSQETKMQRADLTKLANKIMGVQG